MASSHKRDSGDIEIWGEEGEYFCTPLPACTNRPFLLGSGLLPHFRHIVMIIYKRIDLLSNVQVVLCVRNE